VRGLKVLLDTDLAVLYGVAVRALNQAVKRNAQRFPRDFAFRLTAQENVILRSQPVTAASGRGGRRTLPFAFTEHGTIMAASVLNSPRAVEMSIFVVRAFLHMQESLAGNNALAGKLSELEQRLATHDEKIDEIIRTIRVLTMPAEKRGRQIGFHGGAAVRAKMLGSGRGAGKRTSEIA